MFTDDYDFTIQDIHTKKYDHELTPKMPEHADKLEDLRQIMLIARLNVYRQYRAHYNHYIAKHKLYNRMFSTGQIGENEFRQKIRGIEIFSEYTALTYGNEFERNKLIDIDNEYWKLRKHYVCDDIEPKFIRNRKLFV